MMIIYCFAPVESEDPTIPQSEEVDIRFLANTTKTFNTQDLMWERTCRRCGLPSDKERDEHDYHMPVDQEWFRDTFSVLERRLSGLDSNISARTMFDMNDDDVTLLARLLMTAAQGIETLEDRE